MSDRATVLRLRADIERWRAMLPTAEGTYCQGIANKSFGQFELLMKQLLDERLALNGIDLSDLLEAIRYKGKVDSASKLPPGTVLNAIMKLADRDATLGSVMDKSLRRLFSDVLAARNLTTHEVLAPELRERATLLLDMIDEIVSEPDLARVLH